MKSWPRLATASASLKSSEAGTQHNLETLGHVANGLPYTAWLVDVVEFAECWTYYGTAKTTSVLRYLTFRQLVLLLLQRRALRPLLVLSVKANRSLFPQY